MNGTIRVSFVLLICLLAATPSIHVQSLADDIRQLTLDYQKLAQEKKILSDMYTGYTILSKGYDQIISIAHGNFTLHQSFLNALLTVSPAVRNYYKVIGIIDNQARLVSDYQSAQRYFQSDGHFTPTEPSRHLPATASLISPSRLVATWLIFTSGFLPSTRTRSL